MNIKNANKPFIVCELSANHLGDLERAKEIVWQAGIAGASAVKFQTWKPDTMCISDYTLDHGPWAGRKLKDLYREAWTPWEWHQTLFDLTRQLNMIPFSAAFDRESVDFLETLNVDRHKVASFELVDLPLIRYMASKGKPMILSTGMAAQTEITEAIIAAMPHKWLTDITLLKCTSAYPADASDANLRTMAMVPKWGLSDHSLGIGVAVAAVARGAVYIEKHLTLKRKDGGPDAGFSMEPHEFKQMVEECHRAAAAIGEESYGPGPNESTELRRSLWVAMDTMPGEPLKLGLNVVTARPALGVPPGTNLSNKIAFRKLTAGQPLVEGDIL